MLNPDLEIDKLRWNLSDKGWNPMEVDEICDIVSSEINNIILDVVSNASAEAIDYAESKGITQFIDEIHMVEMGSYFHIGTRSGNTDYSTERKEMLPHLLKNADVAKDGTRYKVIPIRDKEAPKPSVSMFDTMKQMQRAQETARASLRENSANNRSARANQMADQFRQAMRKNMAGVTKPVESGKVSFRTATSKQNPDIDWVIPEKDADMTQYLTELNRRIDATIDESILLILDSYYREYS